MHTLETLPKLFSLFCICRPAPARENTTVRPEGFPSPWSEQLDGGGSLLLRLTILFRLARKKEEEEKKRKRENGKQRHAQGVEKWARAQRRPSERDYEMNLLTAAAAAAVVEAREHNDSGRQRRTLFTSPLRVPSSLHRMARIGVRAHCYT